MNFNQSRNQHQKYEGEKHAKTATKKLSWMSIVGKVKIKMTQEKIKFMICYLQPVVKQHHGGAVTHRVRPVHRLVLQRVRDLDREAEHEADVAADRRPSRHTRRGPQRTRDETGAGRGRRRRKAFRGEAEERHRGNFNLIRVILFQKNTVINHFCRAV